MDMFKSAPWRSKKNKIKEVFKLQFHATQVSELKAGRPLVVSVVPNNVGKPTARLRKSTIKDGTSWWECPIYETVEFTRNPKTGNINPRLYRFVLTMDSFNHSLVGEVSVDFAEHAEATKASVLSLPLKGSRSNAVLHVSIQRLQQNAHKSSCSSNNKVNETLNFIMSNCEEDEEIQSHSSTTRDGQLSNGNSEISSDSGITMTSSESSSGINTPQEHELRRNNGPAPSTNASTMLFEELELKKSEPVYLIEIENLKAEIVSLERKLEVSELERQTLRKQIVKEQKRGQNLSKEILGLKEERENREVRSKNEFQVDAEHPWMLAEELHQKLNYKKDENSNLSTQLLKAGESNQEMIIDVKDLEQKLEKKHKLKSQKIDDYHGDDDEDEEDDEKVLVDLVNEQREGKKMYELEERLVQVCSELEMCKRDKDELQLQTEQLALDYEILKQEKHQTSCELEQNQLPERKKIRSCCSSANYGSSEAIDELEARVKSLEEAIRDQTQQFEDDLETVIGEKVKQEQRAIIAEESLTKMRWNNVDIAEKLQDEITKLTMEMTRTLDTNEKAAMEALQEANELRLRKIELEEMAEKVIAELQTMADNHEAELHQLSARLKCKTDHIDRMMLQINRVSKQLHHQKQHDEEISKFLPLKNTTELPREKCDEFALFDISKEESAVLNEIKSLMTKNGLLENELKEMEERYSDISLKFAEVEGERQQLVMTLRNFKNTSN